MNDGRESMRFDPKAAVANTGVPRKKVTWAAAFVQTFLKAPLERAMAASIRAKAAMTVTDEDRQQWALHYRMRFAYGRNWWRSRNYFQAPNGGGERECARRRKQIARGLLSPVYREVLTIPMTLKAGK